MMGMAARKTRKSAERRQAKKAKQKRGKSRSPAKKENVYDLEDLLIDKVIGSGATKTNGTDIENLIYSTTAKTSKLGYSYGFSVGRTLALKLGSDANVDAVLNRIGMHDSIYQPMGDTASIVSVPTNAHSVPNIGRQIHIYESGVMAGFLSTSAGVKVSVVEKRCVYDGSDKCLFEASQAPYPRFMSGSLSDTINGIANAVTNGKYSSVPQEYYKTLSYLPLTDSRIASEIMQIMLMSGEKLGREQSEKPGKVIENIARYFGASGIKIERRGRKSIIKLRYASYNSIRAFVAMPAALITGFYTSRGRSAEVSFSTNRDSSYTTTIEIGK